MSGKIVLINRTKVKTLIMSDLANTSSTVGKLFKQAQVKLNSIAKSGGCGCKKGPKRNIVYEDILNQLRNLDADKLDIIKQHLNATTLNLGKGCQI
jgi:hypothetical protein